ncbi:MAG: hypothetical protein FWD11_09735, partial [Micrococcales bacterium]|nr:hypothetical protein [Micrococcales bacterium]
MSWRLVEARGQEDAVGGLGALGTVVVLLGGCLFALLIVVIARREAGAVRVRAEQDSQAIRDQARDVLAEVERREVRVTDREAHLASEQASLAETRQQVLKEVDEADQARRK